MYFETWLKTDLDHLQGFIDLTGSAYTDDAGSNLIGVKVYKDGLPVNLTGTITAYAIRPDGATVTITGSKEQNRAWVVLPSTCFIENGILSLAIRHTQNSEKITLAACRLYVYRTLTDSIVDPGHVIPSLEDLLAQIEVMENAITRANAASDLCENMTVSASAASGSTPTVTKSIVGGHYNLDFGLVPSMIISQNAQYAKSSSGTTIPASGWSDSIPVVEQGNFLWTKTVITWTGEATSVIYTVARQGRDGTGSVSSVNGVSPDANGNVTIQAGVASVNSITPDNNGNISLPIDNAPTANSDNPVKSSALKTVLDAKAPLASPALTGSPTAPTPAAGTNTTRIATTAFVQAAIVPKSVFSATDTSGIVMLSDVYTSSANAYTTQTDGYVLVQSFGDDPSHVLYIAGSNVDSYPLAVNTLAHCSTATYIRKGMRLWTNTSGYTGDNAWFMPMENASGVPDAIVLNSSVLG